MTATAGIGSIGQVLIPVEDVARAVAFYRDVLGLRFLFDVPGRGMAFFDCGDVRLFLGTPESPEFAGSPVLYYRVPSVDAAYGTLRARGVEFTNQPHKNHGDDAHELWMAFFRDSEGNNIGLMEERPR